MEKLKIKKKEEEKNQEKSEKLGKIRKNQENSV